MPSSEINKIRKTVGIITMHRPDNYGSYLQTYATFKFIHNLGYNVKVIDYAYPTDYHKSLVKVKAVSKGRHLSFIHKKVSGLFRRMLRIDAREHQIRMQDFYAENLSFTKAYNKAEELKKDPPYFDIYVTGSDQVWNPEFTGKDTTFLLSWVPQGKTKIAFSSSFAVKKLSEEEKKLYGEYLKDYKHISIREYSDILRNLGITGKVTLDPTFLISKTQWMSITSEHPLVEGNYILCYLLGYKFDPYPFAYKLIDRVRKETKYKVVVIDGDPYDTLRGYKVMGGMGPSDFINLFAYSSFVITSSFHGTAFAINFEKPFITIINKGTNDNRQVSLVREFNISVDHIVSLDDDVKTLHPCQNVDWSEKLNDLRAMSATYLTKSLEE